jgi:hypothetical protein
MGCGEGHAGRVHCDVIEHGGCSVDLREGDPWSEEMDATSDSFGNPEGDGEGISCAEGVAEETELID